MHALLVDWLTEASADRRLSRQRGLSSFRPGRAGEAIIRLADGSELRVHVTGENGRRLQIVSDAAEAGLRELRLARSTRGRSPAALLRHLGLTDHPGAARLLEDAAAGHLGDRWIDPPPAKALLANVLGRALLEGPVEPATVEAFRGVLERFGEASRPAQVAAQLPALPGDAHVLLLLGDAHVAARALQRAEWQIDAVLEDPPYDTGTETLAYRDTWPEGAWRALLREHLGDLAALLRPGGLALLHIDEHRGAELEALVRSSPLDALGLGIWDKRNPKGDALGLANQHERLIWACRDRKAMKASGGLTRRKASAVQILERAAALHAQLGERAPSAFRRYMNRLDGISEGVRAYRHLDAAGRPYRPVSMAWPNKRRAPDPYFEPLIHPVTGKPCPVPARGWRNPPQTMRRLADEGRLLFGPDESTQPTRTYYLHEVLRENVPSVLAFAGSDDTLHDQLGIQFPYAKPVAFLRTLLDILAPDPEAIVADLFGGSGSTAQAVVESNRDEGLRRTIILAERDPRVVADAMTPRLTWLARQHPDLRIRAVRLPGYAGPTTPWGG